MEKYSPKDKNLPKKHSFYNVLVYFNQNNYETVSLGRKAPKEKNLREKKNELKISNKVQLT